jgi:RHS repeat-associated protein
VPVTVKRVAAAKPIAGKHVLKVHVTGGSVPASVSAVVLNVTVGAPAVAGSLTVYRTGTTRPSYPDMQFAKGQAGSTLVVVRPSAAGDVNLYNGSSGGATVSVDVHGYYVSGSATAAGAFVPVAVKRLVSSVSLAAKHVRRVHVTGGSVPSSVSAMLLDVTVTAPTAAGSLTLYKDGTARPAEPDVQFAKQPTARLVLPAPNASGYVDIYNGSAGSVHLSVDVHGYFRSGSAAVAGAFMPHTAKRVASSASVAAKHVLKVHVGGGDVPNSVSAALLNITVAPAAAGSLTVYKDATTRPGFADLAFAKQLTSGLVLVRPSSSGYVDVYNGTAATMHVSVDLHGYARIDTLPPPIVVPPPATVPGDDVYDRTLPIWYGPNATQLGVAVGTIKRASALLLSGHVADTTDASFSGAEITIAGHPEYGHTLTDTNGDYRMVVNGGSALILQAQDVSGAMTPVQRDVNSSAGGYLTVDKIVLTHLSNIVKQVTLNAATPAIADLGTTGASLGDCIDPNTQQAVDCPRTNTLFVPTGTHATAVAPGGGTTDLTGTVGIRATEYTAGANGPAAMPGDLPSSSSYTYAVDLTVDQAAGAQTVNFTDANGDPQTLFNYVGNFLQFPVGTHVPAAYYDTTTGTWIGSNDGIVIKILSITGGVADGIDSDAVAGADAGPTAYPFTAAERAKLGAQYQVGDELWRVPITHFTPWDYNFPYGCKTVCKPPTLQKYHDPRYPDPCENAGSVIGCENQSLGQRIPIGDTPYTLGYDSSLTPGYGYGRHIRVPASVIPAEADFFDIRISVAGKVYSTSTGDLNTTWDGKDAFGNPVYGPVQATVTATAIYQLVYKATSADIDLTWADWPADGSTIGIERSGSIASFSVSRPVTLNGGAPPAADLGGWSIDAVAHYDPTSHTEVFGDGRTRQVLPVGTTITDLANPTANCHFVSITVTDCGDGGPLSDASIATTAIASGPDGSLYFFDTNELKIRKVTGSTDPTNRSIIAIAGDGTNCTSDNQNTNSCPIHNGQPATTQSIGDVLDLTVAPDGTVYGISTLGSQTTNGNYVFALTPGASGYTFQVVAGDGTTCTIDQNDPVCGDGGPGTSAQVDASYLAATADGVYLYDPNAEHLREVVANGTIDTAYGCAEWVNGCGIDLTEGGAATDVTFGAGVFALAAGPDGSLWLSSTYNSNSDPKVVQIDTSGKLHLFGKAGSCTTMSECGDGVPVQDARFELPEAMSVDDSGTVHVVDVVGSAWVVRAFRPDGVVHTELGAGGTIIDNTSPAGQPAIGTPLEIFNEMTVLPSGQVIFRDARDGNGLLTVNPDESGPAGHPDQILVPSPDGTQYLIFDKFGKELSANDALTNSVLLSFGYDSAGRLISITDEHGRTTTVNRLADGTPTSIVAPSGATTHLTVTSGWLTDVQQPTGEHALATYDANGLMQTFSDFAGGQHSFVYDSGGRLTKDTNANGKFQTLSCIEDGGAACDGYGTETKVTVTSATGSVTSYQEKLNDDGSNTRTVVEPSGATTAATTSPDFTTITTQRPDGSTEIRDYVPDARFGAAAPVLASDVLTRPSHVTNSRTVAQEVTLLNSSDPYTAKKIITTATINDHVDVSTWTFDGTAGTMATTSAEGRTSTETFDAHDRMLTAKIGSTGAQTTYGYDSAGDLTGVTVGGATRHYGYDAAGHLISVTSAGGVQTHYGYDADGRLTHYTDASGHIWSQTYNGNGVRTSLSTPRSTVSGSPYTYASDGEGNLTAFTMPNDANATHKGYDDAGHYTSLTLPDSTTQTRTVSGGDLLSHIAGGGSTSNFTQRANTDDYSSATWQAGGGPTQHLGLVYDGGQVLEQAFSGPATGTLDATVDGTGQTSQLDVHVGATSVSVARTHDKDGLLTAAGPFTLTRDGPGGATTAVTGPDASYAQTVNGLGNVTERTLTVNGTQVFDETLSYNPDHQVTGHTIGGNTVAFGYDADGRLASAGATTYSYDTDGNLTNPAAGSATFDPADRITAAGGTTYSLDEAGRLTARGAADTFSYDASGNLISATVNGTTATYAYDASGRRVAETVNGQTVQYLYGDPANQLQVTAVVEADGSLDVLYRDDRGLLLGFKRNGTTMYYAATDNLGSPFGIYDATGATVYAAGYDAWGNVNVTTSTIVSPLGYAGGLADPVTGFVHFGLRDYDPATGRFTTRDPSLFDGGSNLYAYVADNPVSSLDPSGLGGGFGFAASAYEGVGGGASIGIGKDEAGNVGVSVCVEAGFGVGEGVEVNNDGYTPTSVSVGAELTGKLGMVGGTLGGAITSGPCVPYSEKVGGKVFLGPLAGQLSAQSGPEGWTSEGPSLSNDFTNDLDMGEKIEGKVYAKGCVGTTF